jgi:hypothetical protein
MDRLGSLNDSERHLTGYLYLRENGTLYDQWEILLENYFWFEPAIKMPFIINDCLVHALNYLFRHPIFVTRDQVHRLALRRMKKASDYIIGRKVENGYALSLFANFVVKKDRSYTIEHT